MDNIQDFLNAFNGMDIEIMFATAPLDRNAMNLINSDKSLLTHYANVSRAMCSIALETEIPSESFSNHEIAVMSSTVSCIAFANQVPLAVAAKTFAETIAENTADFRKLCKVAETPEGCDIISTLTAIVAARTESELKRRAV